MTILTIPAYLVGSRAAITRLASSRSALWCGVLFTISAGLAREYDGEDLLNEPWYAVIPLGAALAAGTLLFLIIHVIARTCDRREPTTDAEPADAEPDRRTPPSFLAAYRVFMTLFLMTAPLAWLYAVPYERFLPPHVAMATNLWTLGIVAAWRVLLMVRVVNVLYGIRTLPAFLVIMAFGDALMMLVASITPAPLIGLMGGVRHEDPEVVLAMTIFNLQVCGCLSAPVWIIGAIGSLKWWRPTWNHPSLGDHRDRRLLAFALASIVAFLPALLIAQPEQQRRRAVERLLYAGEVEEAFDMMSAHEVADYPPNWDPPPLRGDDVPTEQQIRDTIRAREPAEWVLAIYLRKIGEWTTPPWFSEGWVEVVEHYAERGDPVEEGILKSMAFVLEYDDSLTDEERAALAGFLSSSPPMETSDDE